MFGCSSGINPSKKPYYKEDLSIYRPIYKPINNNNEITTNNNPTDQLGLTDSIYIHNDIGLQLDSLLDNIALNARAKGFIQAYTVQVYTGNNRESADAAKKLVYQVLPDVTPKLIYIQPNYKVKVGIFYTKLEAYSTYSYLKKTFPTSIIIPERIRMPSR